MKIIQRLFRRPRASSETQFDASPPGLERRLYIVGDVHGRVDLLRRLLRMIVDDAAESPLTFALIFVGDYVDRGDESRAVLDTLLALPTTLAPLGADVVFLKGNHEAFLLDFLDDDTRNESWLDFGGLQTLASYGVGLDRVDGDAGVARAARDLRAALGDHLAFLESLPLFWREGAVYVCHAAVDPDAPLDAQDPRTLLWGDERFLRDGGPNGVVVVHGHTIFDAVDFGRNRIGVDTGAYASGALSALRIDPASGYDVLSTGGGRAR